MPQSRIWQYKSIRYVAIATKAFLNNNNNNNNNTRISINVT